jgi:hypothetical protein
VGMYIVKQGAHLWKVGANTNPKFAPCPFVQTFNYTVPDMSEDVRKTTNSKPIPHILLPFREVIADVLKVKPPNRELRAKPRKKGQKL